MKRPALIILFGILALAGLLMFATREQGSTESTAANSTGDLTPVEMAGRDEPDQVGVDTAPDYSIIDLARSDPLAALDMILGIESRALRQRAILGAAAVWAANDPADMLDAIRAIQDSQVRANLLSAVLSAWSDVDVVAMFRYIAAVDDWDLSQPGTQGPEDLRLGLRLSGDTDYRALAEIVDELPPPFNDQLRRDLVGGGLATQDPAAAARLLESLPSGERRQAGYDLVNAVASTDPLAAFQWARASRESRFVRRALDLVAENDALQAVELALQTEETSNLLSVVQAVIRSESLEPQELAATLAALPTSTRRGQALETLTQAWAVREPEQALEWLVSQGDRVSPALFRSVAERLADPDIAASYLDRIPPAARTDWIQTTADRLASKDPTRALQWIEQYRNEPAYAPSVATIASFMARYDDGGAAADLLRDASLENDASAVSRVARAWAGNRSGDWRAVVDWIGTLASNEVRTSALADVAKGWESSSPDEAERWVLGLPSGEDRDVILYSMISAAFISDTEPSDILFQGYSSDYAREIAAANAAREMESYNEPAAVRLLDRYVKDPGLRRLVDSGEALPPPN